MNTTTARRELTRRGFRRIRCYVGGLADWHHTGYPLDGTVGNEDRPQRGLR